MRALLIAGFALLAAGCDMRCHTQHLEVNYHAAYTSHHQNCTKVSIDPHREICIPYSTYHPPQCSVDTVCDFRCKVLDKNRAEAHPEHVTQSTALINTAPQLCTDGGQVR